MQNFDQLVTAIGSVHTTLRQTAVGSVNRMHTMRNWLIGMYIVEYEQNGSDRAEYGEHLLSKLAERLLLEARGFSKRNLYLFREFYLTYSHLIRQIITEAEIVFSQSKIQLQNILQLPTAKSIDKTNQVLYKSQQHILNQEVTKMSPPAEKLIKHGLNMQQLAWITACSFLNTRQFCLQKR